ncbi:MAG TPA: ISL3 family transposase [Acidimicrobiales bacterium]|nr:ISL3 family transposase [Acidimicrobiales bacterium]
MRATTAFNRIIAIDGVVVEGVSFTPEGVVLRIRRRKRSHQCPCGFSTKVHYDRSIRRWRHLDLGAAKCFLEAEICRIDCSRCRRVRTEDVAWARPGARHTNAFCSVVAWLAQRTDKTTITRLLRISWEAVASIVTDVVGDVLDESRFDGLTRIGVDEVSFRKGHRYLTVVADHDQQGRAVWAHEGKNAATLALFYDELGPERVAKLEAISLDMGLAFEKATNEKAPHVRQCVDPFHLVKMANEAIDKARRWSWNEERRRTPPPRPRGRPGNDEPARPRDEPRWVKHTRWALLKDPDNLTDDQLGVLHEIRKHNSVLYRSWQLKEGLRDLYRLRNPDDAPAHLEWWLRWASRSRIPAFVKLAKTVRKNRERILAAVELNLSNSKLEGLNSKIRLINHRGYGHHSAEAVIAMVYLCCGGLTIELPTTTFA